MGHRWPMRDFRWASCRRWGLSGISLEIRGIGPIGVKIRDEFRLESGRMFRTGAQELIIGVGAARVLGLKIGDTALLPGGFWPIVGTFSNGGDASEGVLFADAETLLSITKRRGYASVIAKLEKRPGAFDELHDWIESNPAITMDADRVSDYLQQRGGKQLAFLTRATYVIGVIMALGALFGATRIMYAAVRARTREIGTLRVLGFGSGAVAGSVLLEAVLLRAARRGARHARGLDRVRWARGVFGWRLSVAGLGGTGCAGAGVGRRYRRAWWGVSGGSCWKARSGAGATHRLMAARGRQAIACRPRDSTQRDTESLQNLYLAPAKKNLPRTL